MKHIFLITFTILSVLACNSAKNTKNEETKMDVNPTESSAQIENIKSDLYYAKIKGKVKSVRQFEYIALEKNGKIEKVESSIRNTSFDIYNEQGNEISSTIYDEGKIDRIYTTQYDKNKILERKIDYIRKNFKQRITYKYDDRERKVEECLYESDPKFIDENVANHSFFLKKIIKYNEAGNKIEESDFILDGSLNEKKNYIYDNKGNKKEINKFDGKENLMGKLIFYYDGKNNLIEEKYIEKGKLRFQTIYKYDNKGNKIVEKHNNSDETLNYKITYKYDDKGNKIEKKEYKSDEIFQKIVVSKYDDYGKVIEEYTKFEDGFEFRHFFKYNEKGLLIEDVFYEYSNGKLTQKITYKEEYDAKENKIKSLIYVDDKLEGITEREIIYYE